MPPPEFFRDPKNRVLYGWGTLPAKDLEAFYRRDEQAKARAAKDAKMSDWREDWESIIRDIATRAFAEAEIRRLAGTGKPNDDDATMGRFMSAQYVRVRKIVDAQAAAVKAISEEAVKEALAKQSAAPTQQAQPPRKV